MSSLPTGTVTFLFTDVEGSTRLWEEHPAEARAAMARHDALIEAAVAGNGGQVVRPRGEGDSRFAVFARASDGVAAAAAIQRALHGESWSTPEPLKVRMAVHTGEADLRDGDYYGSAVNRCARLRAIGHGGQALLSEATAVLVRGELPAGTALRDLGEHRLRDLAAPERVAQLVVPELPSDFAPLRSLDAVPNNLPLQLTSFIGREQEIAEVRQLLAANRLVTLVGSGGAGKTRLSLQAAADAMDAFPDGVWFVELAPLSDTGLIAQAVANALGVREAADRPLLRTLVDHLGAKRALVVLDNCEHMVEAAARLADGLLRGCPNLRVLATSREMLGTAGERTWRIPSLPLPDPRQPSSADGLSQFAAVQLFIDRALAVDPTFAVTNANAPALAQVCHRLDGIPLAIELAAARVRVLTVEQIAARLDDRFRLLTGGSRSALPRQQTLRALVDWSYDLLGENERALLRRLAVFAGGFELEAAEQTCADVAIESYEVLDLLTGLVDKSLVVAERQGEAERYRLLETVRQYALEKLDAAGEAAELRTRHLDWCLALAEQAEVETQGRDQAAWFRRMEAEHDNVRAGLAWAQTAPELAERGLRLAGAMGNFWRFRGYGREGAEWLEAALVRAPDATARARVKGLTWLGHLRSLFGADALAQLEQAIELARTQPSLYDLSLALKLCAIEVNRQGDETRARRLFEEAFEKARAAGHERETAWGLGIVGHYLLRSSRPDEGQRMVEEAVAICRRRGDRTGTSIFLLTLAHCAIQQGDRAQARAMLEEALADAQAIDAPPRIANAQRSLADLALTEGDLARAEALARDAARRFWRAGELPPIGQALLALAGVWLAAGRHEETACLLGGMEHCMRTIGFEPRVPREQPQYAAALDELRAALGEAVLQADLARGRAMTIEQTLAWALDAPYIEAKEAQEVTA